MVAELTQSGYSIVRQSEVDFILTCAAEGNWVTYSHQNYSPPLFPPPPYPVATGAGRTIYLERWRAEPTLPLTRTEEYIRTQGIRLRLYPSQSIRAGRFETAWEGYIEAGLELRAERQPLLVKSLLGWLGRSYMGRVKLAE